MVGGWETVVALEVVLVFGTSLILSLATTPGLIRLGHQFRVLDIPDTSENTDSLTIPRKIHARAVPRLGGLSILTGFLISQFIWERVSTLQGILVSSIILFVTGFVDDIRALTASLRLLIQVCAAALAVYTNDFALHYFCLTPDIYFSIPYWLGFSLSVFIVVGSINAVNFIDGLDGLAGGIVFIGVALLSYAHFLITRDFHILLLISIPIMGALLGFLRFNTHPATIFMGDGGSSWLGFMMGILMLTTLNKLSLVTEADVIARKFLPVTQLSPAVPLLSIILCLGIPVFDTFLVIIGRLKRRQNPLKPDRNHFHHHLLRLGLDQSQSVVAIYFISLVAGICGILPIAFPRYELWWTPWLAAVLIPAVMIVVGKTEGSLLSRLLTARRQLAKRKNIGPKLKTILRYWEGINRYTIYALVGVMPFFAGVPPRPLGYAAAYAAGLVFIAILFPARRMDFLQHLMITFGACVLLAAININQLTIQILGVTYDVHPLYNYAYVALFISTLAHILVTFRKNYLQVSPTDFLLLTVPLLLLLVPEPWNSQYRLSIISMRGLILFMGMRTLVKRQFSIFRRVKLALLAALTYIMAVSLFQLRLIYG